jgi:bacteriochlorophyllide a dehydrogenase
MKTPALLMTAVNVIELGEVDVPAPGAGEVLVKVEYSGISTGTELRCLRGQQAGMPEFPFVPGYNAIGRVVEAGEGAKIPIGTRVFSATTARCSQNRCWGGHCGLHVANENL